MIMNDSNHYKYILNARNISNVVLDCRLPVSAGLSSVSLEAM